MKPIKIVHVIGNLSKGGAERFVVDLCNELAKNSSLKVILLSLKDNALENSFVGELDGRVQYYSFGKKSGLSLGVLYKITKFIYHINPEIVHSHLNAFEYVCISQLLRNNRGLYFHTLHSKAERECSNFLVKQIRKYYYSSKRVNPVTISQDGRNSFRRYYYLENDVLIYNGRPDFLGTSEISDFETNLGNEDSYLLLHVGRIVKVKNQAFLIKAVKMYNERNEKRARLIIVGEVRDIDVYENLLELIDGDPFIQILGGKSNIGDYLKKSDAFCLTSEYEGMPISLIEALSMKCIPICTPVGGIPEMIENNKSGFLSKDESLESFVEALERFNMCRTKEEIAFYARRAFEENFHISVCSQNHLRAYRLSVKVYEDGN